MLISIVSFDKTIKINRRRNKMCYYGEEMDQMYLSRIKSEDSQYLLEIPVPGFEKSNLKISVQESQLMINGDNGEQSFKREYSLSDGIDQNSIGAEVINGLLKVKLPKLQKETKEIQIN